MVSNPDVKKNLSVICSYIDLWTIKVKKIKSCQKNLLILNSLEHLIMII